MLFDLQKDPGETRNLAGDQAHSRLLAEHRKLLQEWMARTGDNSLDASVSTAG
jgi:choline-sulfatase